MFTQYVGKHNAATAIMRVYPQITCGYGLADAHGDTLCECSGLRYLLHYLISWLVVPAAWRSMERQGAAMGVGRTETIQEVGA